MRAVSQHERRTQSLDKTARPGCRLDVSTREVSCLVKMELSVCFSLVMTCLDLSCLEWS